MSGSYPIKAQTLSVGESVPLGVSTAGVAMLATMDDAEVRHAVQYNAVAITKFRSVRPDEIYAQVEETRKRGYSLYYGQIVAGMGGVGRAIRDAKGVGVAVISVTALLDRLSEDRVRFIAKLLEDGVAEVEQRARLVGNILGA
jgi:DNA-binding IclR family transcriptional regulator